MITIPHEQNVICSKTHFDSSAHEQMIICRQLFEGHVVGSWCMKKKEKIHQNMRMSNSTDCGDLSNLFYK